MVETSVPEVPVLPLRQALSPHRPESDLDNREQRATRCHSVRSIAHAYLGVGIEEARTAAATVLFTVALWIVALVARPLTPARQLLLAGMAALFAIVLADPALRTFFALELPGWRAWFAVIGIALIAVGVLHWSSSVAAHAPSTAIKSHPLKLKDMVVWLLGADSPKWFVLAASVLVVGGAWLFFVVLEDVISRDPLVDADVLVYRLLQSGRTPTIDGLMVAITELGDVNVFLPVIGGALIWFVARRLWVTAGYWLAAVGVAELLTKVLKLALHRPRPGMVYLGIEQFSFPSGHATMSVVAYGFLAFLLCRGQVATVRKRITIAAATLVTLIALSRLYLGAHWLSDVVGGMAFGVAWIALLALAHTYQSTEDIRPRQLTVLMGALLVVAGSLHIGLHHASDVARYSALATMRESDWTDGLAMVADAGLSDECRCTRLIRELFSAAAVVPTQVDQHNSSML